MIYCNIFQKLELLNLQKVTDQLPKVTADPWWYRCCFDFEGLFWSVLALPGRLHAMCWRLWHEDGVWSDPKKWPRLVWGLEPRRYLTLGRVSIVEVVWICHFVGVFMSFLPTFSIPPKWVQIASYCIELPLVPMAQTLMNAVLGCAALGCWGVGLSR